MAESNLSKEEFYNIVHDKVRECYICLKLTTQAHLMLDVSQDFSETFLA